MLQSKKMTCLAAGVGIVSILAGVMPALAQFTSGSDGSDGALEILESGEFVFDPVARGLDQDGDGVYHFTSIKIGNSQSTTIVYMRADVMPNLPIRWLAADDVVIEANARIVLDGDDGADGCDSVQSAAVPGPGGFAGGRAASFDVGGGPPEPGAGPGGGRIPQAPLRSGGNASHATVGTAGGDRGEAGDTYGSILAVPLIGGSGGAGGGTEGGSRAGGGAGGGAILIASDTRIEISGQIRADGGNNGRGSCFGSSLVDNGGGGSGGTIRVIAPEVELTSSARLSANGAGGAGQGRIRVEAGRLVVGSGFSSSPSISTGGLSPVFSTELPTVRIRRVDGVDVPANPTGNFNPADVTINAPGSVTIDIEASKIPIGTVVDLRMTSEIGTVLEIQSTPLQGTLEASTATAVAEIPFGNSRFSVVATWDP